MPPRVGPALSKLGWFALVGGAIWGLGAYETYRTPSQVQQLEARQAQASTGREIWVAPGYVGKVEVYSADIQSTGGYWEAKPGLTLTLHGPSGSTDIIGTSDRTQDWGNSHLESPVTVDMTMSISVPAGAAVGTEWTGSLTGTIVTGSDFDGMILPESHDVNLQGITLHVASPDEVARRAQIPDGGRGIWTVIQWGLPLILLIAGLYSMVRVLRGKSWIPLPTRAWDLIDRVGNLVNRAKIRIVDALS